jgi:hypothetical protein
MRKPNQPASVRPRVRGLLIIAITFAFAFGAIGTAAAQRIPTPPTPISITPSSENSAFLAGHATGTQGYVCPPTSTGASWTVNGSRPEATLFVTVFGQEFEIITHFRSPDTNPK